MIDIDYVPTIPFDLWEAPYGCVAAQSEMEELEMYFNTNSNGGPNMRVAPVCKKSGITDMFEGELDPTMDPSGITDLFEGQDPTMDPSGITDMFEDEDMDPTMDPVERTVECTVEFAAGNMECPTAKCLTPSPE